MIEVIKFSAPWCGTCKRLSPAIEAIKEDFPTVIFKEVNVDNEPDVAAEYGVMSLPTVVFKVDGNEETRFTGVRPQEYIEDLIRGL